jgi:hypothetical protein
MDNSKLGRTAQPQKSSIGTFKNTIMQRFTNEEDCKPSLAFFEAKESL